MGGKVFCLILLALYLPIFSQGFSLGRNCDSPQYVSFGKRSTLVCNLGIFTAISWYKVANNDLLIHYKRGVRSEMNQKRGIFGISDDGGLVINNVSVEHETRYKVVKYTTDTRKEIFEIEVKVLGRGEIWKNDFHGNKESYLHICPVCKVCIIGLFAAVTVAIYLDYKLRRKSDRKLASTVKETYKGKREHHEIQLKDSDSEEDRKEKIYTLMHDSKYKKIPTRVNFVESFDNCDGKKISMTPLRYNCESLSHLPPLDNVNSITFVTKLSKNLTSDDVGGILEYGMRSRNLENILFLNGIMKNCPAVKIPKGFCNTGIQVSDQENGNILDFKDGIWKSAENYSEIKRICEETVCISEDGTEGQHTSILRLLSKASQSKILISCLFLNESFDKVEDSGILLSTGTALPELSTVRQLRIIKRKRVITEKELVEILRYGQASNHLKTITLIGVMLPYETASENIPLQLRERLTKVNLHPTTVKSSSYTLNLKSGKLTSMHTKKDLNMEQYKQLMNEFKIFWRRQQSLNIWRNFDNSRQIIEFGLLNVF